MPFGSGLPALFPTLTWQCNPQTQRIVDEVLADRQDGAVILDMGAGGRRLHPSATTVDFVQMEGTDVASDVCDTPFENDHADLVVATGLIEHLDDDDAFLREAFRVLAPGGRIYIEVPFMQQYHDDPIDSRRYSAPGLERLLTQHGFEPVRSGFHIGPGVAIATLNAYYAAMLFEGEGLTRRVLSNGAFFIVSTLLWPLTRLDRWMKHRRSAHRLAFGVYCEAVKPRPEAQAEIKREQPRSA